MTVVSINAFDDAELLRGCLESVREQLPHARVQVIDGRYLAFPAPADNSSDETEAVADTYDAEYYPDGPHEDEPAKHWQRVERAPEGERVLFLDADERLVTFGPEGFDEDTIYRARVHNAACYDGGITYYPRYFYPNQLDDIPRVDRFWFGELKERRTDRVTISHRADLRDRDYQDRKRERLECQDRDWYGEYLNEIRGEDIQYEFDTCPECGNESLRVSRVCGFNPDESFTRVETCVASDRCHAEVRSVDGPELPEEFQYVPDRGAEPGVVDEAIERGFREDAERLRLELMAAGNPIAMLCTGEVFERYAPNAKAWVREEWLDAGNGLSQTA